ncbi:MULTISPECIES: glycerophosphodiester phosphodiesterase [Mumia]|uniref:glycerophosphodiester phosphodiesterase n=1 Tax=Mumia TaxID=1546255 RepID=UPI00142359BD|nr:MULTISPECIES: glycerophosphodiester phosphodiesterase [unclassified Mumia]QMW66050.1 glycerophosphodiester phosphodiesterase [Mumia sp. ZJ1417]
MSGLPGPAGNVRPVVIAHRGASGYRPEHTLASYLLSVALGADVIEPDLVSTADGVLVARHENEIGGTTDVAAHPEFAGRRTTRRVDGREVTGWFTEDFTLAELKTLRARERIPQLRPSNTSYDGWYEVPTLDEILGLAEMASYQFGRRVGVVPELKTSTYFRERDLPLEEPLLRAVREWGLDAADSGFAVQSFEVANLQRLAADSRLRLVQLVEPVGAPYDRVRAGDPLTYAEMVRPTGLARVAEYAHVLGAPKDLLLPRTPAGELGSPSGLTGDAHAAGLEVYVWTVRRENAFLPVDLRSSEIGGDAGDVRRELDALLALGVDGMFADQPDVAVEAVAARVARYSPRSVFEIAKR